MENIGSLEPVTSALPPAIVSVKNLLYYRDLLVESTN